LPFAGRLDRECDFMLRPEDISLAELIEITQDAALLVDPQGRVHAWNRGCERMFGWRNAEVLGRDCRFFVPADLSHERDPDWLGKSDGKAASQLGCRTRRLHAHGHEVPVSLTRTLLRDTTGELIGWVELLRGPSGPLAEEPIEPSSRTEIPSQWAAVVAHQIKNPLAGIYATIQLLARGVSQDDPRAEVFDKLVREIHRLDQVSKDLLGLALPRRVRPVEMELRAFVIDLAASLEGNFGIERHRIELGLAHEMRAEIDPTLLAQALESIVRNAAEAMGQSPGRILLSLREEGDRVLLDVEDEGPGIAPEALPSVFEPFFTTKACGTGLGLSIARRDVESMGGTIAVTSELGRGARFRLTFPRKL
jgi:PAS domain S-box-containing protein